MILLFAQGQFLVEHILRRSKDLELAFVWNRSGAALRGRVDDELIIDRLEDVVEKYYWRIYFLKYFVYLNLH